MIACYDLPFLFFDLDNHFLLWLSLVYIKGKFLIVQLSISSFAIQLWLTEKLVMNVFDTSFEWSKHSLFLGFLWLL